MADINPRIAWRRLENFAEENDLPTLDEWRAIDIRKVEDSDEPEAITVHHPGGSTDTDETEVPMRGISITDVFAAREYGLDNRGIDIGDISIDSPTAERHETMADRGPIAEQVAEAMRRADEAIGGRERLGVRPEPAPTITQRITKRIKVFINRMRARF